MGRCRWIGLLSVIVMLAACHRPAVVEPVCTSVLPSELAAIDTLMQTRPDSALTLLMDTVRDDPYYHLLLSEALYKNDYAQANRAELLEAMAYFDSIHCPFLSARSHYMNGVGYYETDSVVDACGEYMKALEIMEENYAEQDFTGHKAKFMALTYTHLCELFSDQYLQEQTIFFGKQSIPYYKKYDASLWHIAWILNVIGSRYDMMQQWDSAGYYYKLALEALDNSNLLLKRDISAHQNYLSYEKGGCYQDAIDGFYTLLNLSESEREYTARCLSLGEIFYHEHLFDSAYVYLDVVYEHPQSINAKKQAAEWLAEICKAQKRDVEAVEYAEFLLPFANKEENKSVIKSQLTELYSLFLQNSLERLHQQSIRKRIKWTILMLSGSFMIIGLITFFKIQRKTSFQIHEETSEKKWNNLERFFNEPVCQGIILSLQGKNIKRLAVPKDYPELILNEEKLQLLALTINRYFSSFESILEQHGLNSNPVMVHLCHLYLLGIDEKQAAILLNRDYSSIKRYEKKLKTIFKTQSNMVTFMRSHCIDI